MSIGSVSGVFAGASVVGTDLVIPLDSLPSFSGTEGDNVGGECVLGLLEALIDPVNPLSSGGFTRANSTSAVRVLANGSGALTKTYTFSCVLGVDLDANPLNIIVG